MHYLKKLTSFIFQERTCLLRITRARTGTISGHNLNLVLVGIVVISEIMNREKY